MRKNVTMENLKFWRTTAKKEIDFIVNDFQTGLLAYEVKLRDSGKRPSSFSSFIRRYPTAKCFVVTLYKNQKSNYSLYPWELFYNYGE